MRERAEHDEPQPLPGRWLPDASPPDDSPLWAARIDRIIAASAPDLQRMKNARIAAAATPWSVMGHWWKPAAALAAASLLLFVATYRPRGSADSRAGSILLGIVASQGDPVALWGALGIEAEPVLALVAIQNRAESPDQPAPLTVRKENER